MPARHLSRPAALALLAAAFLGAGVPSTSAAVPTAPASALVSARGPALGTPVVTVPVRIGSYNIRAGEPLENFEAGVEEFKTHIDVGGLQETNQGTKRAYLADMVGWGSYVPLKQQNPVIWDESKFVFVSGRGVLIAKGRDIGDEMPRNGSFRADSIATVVHLRHLVTGQPVSIINLHLLAGATSNGVPRLDRPKMVSFYKDQVRNAALLVDEEAASGQVFVMGDFNVGYAADAREHRKALPYTKLTGRGLVAMWRDCGTTGKGTHGPQYIDQIWTTGPATSCEVAYDIRHSDHYPIAAAYPFSPVTGLPPVPGPALP
ncbi:hypothetical protein H5V45_07710 [Nocardioides sp. KIGAM211]|uniref:Endonuclease/exonuclease/phosphatase domain-containing protein n=1 Tax=Nocardioides luti TaxID=2761101 RepID=A0A7X0VA47_9ACTN|nr:endonuclease/exonuclease/phosphatase family protein [Nocardioides luti]MBB6627206.1 hypothetical protein [Nocardioides luti]